MLHGYIVVAEFIIQSDTASYNIKEALKILKKWNADWTPEILCLGHQIREWTTFSVEQLKASQVWLQHEQVQDMAQQLLVANNYQRYDLLAA